MVHSLLEVFLLLDLVDSFRIDLIKCRLEFMIIGGDGLIGSLGF